MISMIDWQQDQRLEAVDDIFLSAEHASFYDPTDGEEGTWPPREIISIVGRMEICALLRNGILPEQLRRRTDAEIGSIAAGIDGLPRIYAITRSDAQRMLNPLPRRYNHTGQAEGPTAKQVITAAKYGFSGREDLLDPALPARLRERQDAWEADALSFLNSPPFTPSLGLQENCRFSQVVTSIRIAAAKLRFPLGCRVEFFDRKPNAAEEQLVVREGQVVANNGMGGWVFQIRPIGYEEGTSCVRPEHMIRRVA